MVNVPPCMSATLSLPSRAARPRRPISLLDLGDAHLIGIAHDRHDKALVGADRHTDMGIVLVDDVRTVDLGVDRRNFLQRMRHRLGEEAHEAKLHAMLLLEHVLVLRRAGPSPPSCPPR